MNQISVSLRQTLALALGVGLVLLLGLSLDAQASTHQGVEDYNQIVQNLSRRIHPQHQKAAAPTDPFDQVKIHAGVGFISSFETIALPNGPVVPLGESGLRATLGIDLFDPEWIAEGSASSYGGTGVKNAHVGLSEFELKVITERPISQKLAYRLGAGLSARYLDLTNDGSSRTYATPSSVFLVGIETFISKELSLGVDGSYQSSLIGDTIDQHSLDLNLKLEARF